MAGLSRFAPKPDFQPAGYLPAPQQARFISEAEQAAEKLPPTIKSQSLKNALLKGGAKPLELEYAGIDDFISQNQGKPVSAADVLSHLRTEGPLGKLKRVEQQTVNGQPEDIDESPLTYDEHVESGDIPMRPAYAENVRAPFDPSFASNQTRYHNYTVPGKKGDFAGYREVLLEDPKNSKGTGNRLIVDPQAVDSHEIASYQEDIGLVLDRYGIQNAEDIDWNRIGDNGYITIEEAEQISDAQNNIEDVQGRGTWAPSGPVEAHRADYWARYNEYSDRIAVQNIQSDVGQDYSKQNTNEGQLEGMNAHLRDLQQRSREIADEMARTPRGHGAISRLEFELSQTEDQVTELLRLGDQYRFNTKRDADGNYILTQSEFPTSPITKDGNWKNLMARHIALQSIQGMGKPITIPTGQQMVDVEGFGMGTHNNRDLASKAATDFNTDLVRRLQKIFRGLHPDGATVSTPPVPEPTPEPIITAIGNRTADYERKKFLLESRFNANRAWASGVEDKKIDRILMNGGSLKDLEMAVARGGQSDAFRDAAMQAIQYDRLMQEMGNPGVVAGTLPPPPAGLVSRHELRNKIHADAWAPGWTIKPSPMAVRQALEKGLPIMSLAPLLLSPQEEQR